MPPDKAEPDKQNLRQGGADILLREAGDELADGQAVPSAQSVQQRHAMKLHLQQSPILPDLCCQTGMATPKDYKPLICLSTASLLLLSLAFDT